MSNKYYRVETADDINLTKNYNSNEFRYGRNIDFSKNYHFLTTYYDVMKEENIPSNFLILLNNLIYDHGENYESNLRKKIVNDKVDLSLISNDLNFQNYQISASSIIKFLDSFKEPNEFYPFDNGILFWEFILECVRSNFYNDSPCRLKSVFLFDNLDSCDYYNNTVLGGYGKIYEIELVKIDKIFEGDMKIIDNIENHIQFHDLLQQIDNYWYGELTAEPVKEIIFQGIYKYKKIA